MKDVRNIIEAFKKGSIPLSLKILLCVLCVLTAFSIIWPRGLDVVADKCLEVVTRKVIYRVQAVGYRYKVNQVASDIGKTALLKERIHGGKVIASGPYMYPPPDNYVCGEYLTTGRHVRECIGGAFIIFNTLCSWHRVTTKRESKKTVGFLKRM